ncbi:MAG TPA: carboxypeptidase regulatory-like domain-containing protein, partial [Bryobacteraceae bacterium]|nr:carboxypeptidase regulatory-like domain-containing protein [Bryobacteraceae bacterium]
MRLLACLVLLAGALWASPTATLTGRVTDPTGAAMPGVEALAINVETGLRMTTLTNDEGLYNIPQLAPGTYRIVLRKHGFKMILKTGVELRVQDIIALNFEMQIGSVDQSITVEEGVPLLQAETATLGQTIDRNVIAELPTLTRNPYDFVALSAGATSARNASGRGVAVAINGQRAESANFLLDGGDNTNPTTSNPGQTVSHEAVREYRVLTNGFTAEYGRNSGFVANLVTKSGTNEFHGSLYDYARNSRLAANSFENNARRDPRAVFNRHQAGASLGGPIVKDKAFFFGSFESILIRSSDTRTFRVPTPQLLAISSPATREIFRKYPLPPDLSPTELVTRPVRPFGGGSPVTLPVLATTSRIGPVDAGAGPPQDTYLGTARVDYTLGSRTMFMGRYSMQDVDQFAAVSQPYTPELDQPLFWRNQNAALSLTRVWSTGVVSESRLVYARLLNTRPAAGPGGWFGSLTIMSGGGVLPGADSGSAAVQNLYQANHATSWARNKHFVKFGGSVVHYRDASLVPRSTRAAFANFQG